MVSAFAAILTLCALRTVFPCFFPFKRHVLFTLACVVHSSLFFTDFGGFRGSISGPLAPGNEKNTVFWGVHFQTVFGKLFFCVLGGFGPLSGRFWLPLGAHLGDQNSRGSCHPPTLKILWDASRTLTDLAAYFA